MLSDKALLVCSASVLRRECVEQLNGFDPDIRLMEDADFHVRATRKFGAHFIDHTAIKYRIGSPSLMHPLIRINFSLNASGPVIAECRRNIAKNGAC
jgi:hypothetical protein